MQSRTLVLLIVNAVVFMTGMAGVVYKKNHPPQPPLAVEAPRPNEGNFSQITTPPELAPIKISISNPQPSYLNYDQTVAKLKQWAQEAPELSEVGTYGKSSRGKDLHYFRLCNKRFAQATEKPRVLVTACIHGNEPLAASTTMWHLGALLSKYGKDEAITQLVDSRDIYFVPVVSPDSYPSSRHVDGVDPNRDFPGPSRPNHRSVAPVAAIQNLFRQIKPNAVISGHTWGRVYLTPHGDTMKNCNDHEAIMRVMNRCKELSGYRCIRACDMYGANGGLNNPPIRTLGEGEYGSSPIYGTEVDWYYRNGAFAIVCEFGTHQRIPSDDDTRTEFNKTFSAFLHFVREAPLVPVRPSQLLIEYRGVIGNGIGIREE